MEPLWNGQTETEVSVGHDRFNSRTFAAIPCERPVFVFPGSGALVAHKAHNLEVVGSIPTSPTFRWWRA